MTQSQLNQLTLEQLSNLNEIVVKTIKAKRRQLATQTKINLGQKVKVNHPKLQGRSLIVKKINRTTATLQVEGAFGSYKVPISMIEV